MNSVLLPQLHPSVRLRPAKLADLPFLQTSAVLEAGVVIDKAKANAYYAEALASKATWSDTLDKLKDRLTFVPKYDGVALEAYKETFTSIIIPRCWPGSTPEAFELLPNHLSLGATWPADNRIFQGSLRPEQEDSVTALYAKLMSPPHATLAVMPCGFGKTVVALALAARVRRRVLVVVHKEFLLTQWRERIALFLPDVQVTILGGGRGGMPAKRALSSKASCTSEVVIALIQSLVRCCDNTLLESETVAATERHILTNIGFMIFDECHHMAARTFSTVFFHIPAKYVLGLSATPTRRDGCTPVLMWHFNAIGYQYKPSPPTLLGTAAPLRRHVVRVMWTNPKCVVRTTTTSSSSSSSTSQQQLLQVTQKMRDALIRDQERNEWLVRCCNALAPKGQVLLLSHRREHLQSLLSMFEQSGLKVTDTAMQYRGALYVGGLTEARRVTASTAHVLFGTFQMAAEGLDIPTLSALILATPTGDIEQALGRILRISPQKHEVWVLDVEDEFHQSSGPVAGMLRNWCRQRQRTLSALDFTVHHAASAQEAAMLLTEFKAQPVRPTPLIHASMAGGVEAPLDLSVDVLVDAMHYKDDPMEVDPFDL